MKSFILLFIICLAPSVSFAQGPAGYIYCAREGESFTLPAKSHVAYGADGKFKFLYNQTGTIIFNTATFDGDPIFGTVKSGFYKLVTAQSSGNSLITIFTKTSEHLKGITTLTPVEINGLADSLQENIFAIADSVSLVRAASDLISYYEAKNGPIFINSKTKGGFANDFGAADGLEIDRLIFKIQQGFCDYVYTAENLQKYKTLLDGKKFLTADYFPGKCPSPSPTSYTSIINATMAKEWGKRTAFSSTPARRPTGYYLSPGTIATVTVPAGMVNKGFTILVGAHTFERTGNNPVRRFFRVTRSFPITQVTTEIANPFGGGIYIVTPYLADLGLQSITLKNVVPAPFFSATSANATSLDEWRTTQRTNSAPWADFASDKFMMQVPTSWIYNYDDPVTLMKHWDMRMDAVSELLGYPLLRNTISLYLQTDVDIMFGAYGIGFPQINNPYNPDDIENGNKDHWFLRPGPDFWEIEFHEMGHAQLSSKFNGEEEAAVNLLAAAIWCKKYNMDIDSAFGKSFINRPYLSRDQAALNWMVTPNFRAGKAMDISNTTKDEVRYQHRGYAKYVEMAALFGWSVLDSFHRHEHLDFIANTLSDGLTPTDSRMLRFSREAGCDVRPLIHFWGVHPVDSATLKKVLQAEGLKPSHKIYDRLMHYKSIIPMDSAAFRAHAEIFNPGGITAGESPDYGEGWYYVWLPLYNQTHGAAAKDAMQYIIDLYFPNGRPEITSVEQNSISNSEPSIRCSPNPFNQSLVVEYSLPTSDDVTVKIFDTYGREVTGPENAIVHRGASSFEWNAETLSPGVYIIQISARETILRAKVVFY